MELTFGAIVKRYYRRLHVKEKLWTKNLDMIRLKEAYVGYKCLHLHFVTYNVVFFISDGWLWRMVITR